MPFRDFLSAFVFAASVAPVFADDTLYRYEADVSPCDPSTGWICGNPCELPCTDSVENGHYVLRFAGGGDLVGYGLIIAEPSQAPPKTLWVEWRFRSNHPIGPNFFGCDAHFTAHYQGIHELVNMYGDAAISFSGDDAMFGLSIEDFHTYRFESLDGVNYRIALDGQVFIVDAQNNPNEYHFLQLGGRGGCDGFPNTVNEWDFVRYGTIAAGERIIASDPPSGSVDPLDLPGLDRFTVTFDAVNYVYIDDVTVSVTGGVAPTVIATRRVENTEPDLVEIVLDRRPPFGETTSFLFDTGDPSVTANCDPAAGEVVNCVRYTLPPAICGDGVVNQPGENCDGSDDPACPGTCPSDCTCPVCGDNVVEGDEECDEGFVRPTCDADCTLAVCGDGTVNTFAGEQCDEGAANSDTAPDACRTNCLFATCGDDVTDGGEQCDGMDDALCPGLCRGDCQCPACGDGVLDAGEACDDGLANSNVVPDACRNTCVLPACGDGVTDAGEACDGADDAVCPDACRANCRCPSCGDGLIDPGEQCDNGSANSDTTPDACRTSCALPVCGDNVTDRGEECDGDSDDTCPGDCRPDCTCRPTEIPGLSQWGLLALGLLLLAGARIRFGKE